MGHMKLAQLLIIWFHSESLDLKILKIYLQILVNNLQGNGTDLKKVSQLQERLPYSEHCTR
jgi:hypothetical protein